MSQKKPGTVGFTKKKDIVALVHKKPYVDDYLSVRRFGEGPRQPLTRPRQLTYHLFRTISAHHDGQRLWLIALPVAQRTPIRSTALHPNTMGDAPHARLGRNQRWGRVIGGDLPKQIMSIFFIRTRPSPS